VETQENGNNNHPITKAGFNVKLIFCTQLCYLRSHN
jgi:hypothetical protein